MRASFGLLLALASTFAISCAAEPGSGDDHSGHDHGEGEDHSGHDHEEGEDHSGHDHEEGEDHSGHGHEEEAGEHGGHDHGDEAEHEELDWCGEHGLPESACTVCNPGLIDEFQADGDWCAGHGFPESVCPSCNPQTPPTSGGAADADWCGEHGLPESACTVCNPGLIDEFQAAGDWCAGHGFPESVCPSCNPQTPPTSGGAADADWCGEHGLPESACTTCNPSLVAEFQSAGDWCVEHAFPESVCPTCNPQPAPAGASTVGTVHLTDAALNGTGLQLQEVRRGAIAVQLDVSAEIQFNPDRVAHVSSLVSGQIQSVEAAVGDPVEVGQTLVELNSVELGQARAELSRARALLDVASQNRDRQERLRAEGISSERSLLEAQLLYEEAEAERGAARSRLRVFGVTGGSGPGLTLESPIEGVVVERHATQGENVSPDETLLVVADVGSVWVIGRVYEQQLSRVSPGMHATLTLTAYPGREWSGRVDFVGMALDEATRTLPIRVELDNPDGVLRPGLFGTLRLSSGTTVRSNILVPLDAVQEVDGAPVVFIEGEHSGEFAAVRVALGPQDTRQVEVTAGLSSGQRVVVEGAFALKSELLRGNLGDGCAH